jgi:inositol-phosphate phosphatase/L-galactose 1-phosphate phosphatase/histidinol-phosphatase
VLDPIDGTAAFITGKPSFGTLIALAHRGRPVLGIIDQAFTDERWLGVQGRPTTLNGQPAKVRACPDLAHGYAFTTAPELFCPQTRPGWDRIAAKVKRVRYGCDCYAYALLASGFVDVVVEAGLKPYDFAALVPVIQGAGGVMTDWSGQPLTIESVGRVCAAGDARTHAEALRVLAWRRNRPTNSSPGWRRPIPSRKASWTIPTPIPCWWRWCCQPRPPMWGSTRRPVPCSPG